MARPDDDRPRPKRGGGRSPKRGGPTRGAGRPPKRGAPKHRGSQPKQGGWSRGRGTGDRDDRKQGRGRTQQGAPRKGKRPAGKPRARRRDDTAETPSSRPSRAAASGEAAAIFREARRAAKRATEPARRPRRLDDDHLPPVPSEQEEWLDEGRVDDPSARRGRDRARPPTGKRGRSRGRGPSDRHPPAPSGRAAPLSDLSDKEHKKLRQATAVFEDEQFNDARRILNDLARAHPDVPEVRELLGLTHYRLENWRAGARELEAFASLSGSTEQHPVLADCYRAVRRHKRVDDLWEELAAASPSAPLVAEGRIVTAGSLADRGDMGAAIAHLEPAVRRQGKLRPHDLRVLYSLADLYERAGETPTARELFARVVHHDRRFADAARRLDELG